VFVSVIVIYVLVGDCVLSRLRFPSLEKYRVAIKSGNIDNIMLFFFLQIEDVLDERRSYYVYSPMFPDFMATL
jgi:hypothetical protein